MGTTYPIFELNLTLDLSYLYTKFCGNRIEIATSSVYIYTHTHTHTHTHIHMNTYTENLSSRKIGGEL